MSCSEKYRIIHETRYRYATSVHLSQHLLRLTPRPCAWQTCAGHRIDIEPRPTERVEREDYFGNRVVQIALEAPHEELLVYAESVVFVAPHAPMVDRTASWPWERVRQAIIQSPTTADFDAAQFAFASPHVQPTAEFQEFARPSFGRGRPVLEAVRDLTERIYEQFEFDREATSVATPAAEVLRQRRGVCQDFAHLQIACLRATGLAARYVSGYILTTPPPGQPRLVGADASHAWVSVFVPDLGWIDFDPTNNVMPDTRHITLAWGRDFGDISPLRGLILGGGAHELEVRVSVLPLAEAEKPFAGWLARRAM